MVFGSVLITGTDQGIGFHFVKQLLLIPEVELIVATCLSPKGSKELQALAQENDKVQIVQMDVKSQESIQNAKKTVEETLGDKGLNWLINNAGISRIAPSLEAVTADMFKETYAVNTVGPFMTIQAFLPLLEKAAQTKPLNDTDVRRGAVVNISSTCGSIASLPVMHKKVGDEFGNIISYFCSKAALNMITGFVALEKPNITIISIYPGWVNTELGGPNAELTVEQSTASMVKTFQNLKSEHTGGFFDWEGNPLPW